jgi:hypothetical protein
VCGVDWAKEFRGNQPSPFPVAFAGEKRTPRIFPKVDPAGRSECHVHRHPRRSTIRNRRFLRGRRRRVHPLSSYWNRADAMLASTRRGDPRPGNRSTTQTCLCWSSANIGFPLSNTCIPQAHIRNRHTLAQAMRHKVIGGAPDGHRPQCWRFLSPLGCSFPG